MIYEIKQEKTKKVNMRDSTSNVAIDEISNGFVVTLPMVVVVPMFGDEQTGYEDYNYETKRLFVSSVEEVAALVTDHYNLQKWGV